MFSFRGRKRQQPKSLAHNPQSNVFAHVASLIPNQISTSRVVLSNQNRPTKEVALLAQYIGSGCSIKQRETTSFPYMYLVLLSAKIPGKVLYPERTKIPLKMLLRETSSYSYNMLIYFKPSKNKTNYHVRNCLVLSSKMRLGWCLLKLAR